MELTLHTEATIDSCHKLEDYNGKCQNLHGHTWKLDIWFKGDSTQKDKVGILVDFGIVKQVVERLDHKYLNEEISMNPTAENLTEWIYKYIKRILTEEQKDIKVKVRIYETCVDKQTYCEGGDF